MTKKFAWPQRLPTTVGEVIMTCQVIGLTTVLRLFLRWVKLPRLLQEVTPRGRDLTVKRPPFSMVVRYVDSMLRRFPSNPRGSCLVRSLSLYYFGRRYGYPVHFHCGVSRADGEFKGHAWLSLDGSPFHERGNPFATYTVTFSYPPLKGRGEPATIWPIETSFDLEMQNKK